MESEEKKVGRKQSYGEGTSTIAFRIPDSKIAFIKRLVNRFLSKWKSEHKDDKK